eukprot:3985697-Amphidinium_carterae.1
MSLGCNRSCWDIAEALADSTCPNRWRAVHLNALGAFASRMPLWQSLRSFSIAVIPAARRANRTTISCAYELQHNTATCKGD